MISEHGEIGKEAQATSELEALTRWIRELDGTVSATGLEAGPLSQWLHRGLTEAGLDVVLMETRQVKGTLKAMPIKTDRRDAEGIARLLHLGWFRPAHCKSVSAQEVRALLGAGHGSAARLHRAGALPAGTAAELRVEGRRDLPWQVRAPHPGASGRQSNSVRRDRADTLLNHVEHAREMGTLERH